MPQIEFGVVYSCVENKMYTARRGKGAFCNGEPIKVSGQEGWYAFVVVTVTCLRSSAMNYSRGDVRISSQKSGYREQAWGSLHLVSEIQLVPRSEGDALTGSVLYFLYLLTSPKSESATRGRVTLICCKIVQR